jgi:hypothetical protein
VDAADPAGGEGADPSEAGGDEGGADGRAAVDPLGEGEGEVARGELAGRGRGGEARELGGVEADAEVAVQGGDNGRGGASAADGGAHARDRFEVVGVREAVGEHGGLKGDDGPTGGELVADLGVDLEHGGACEATPRARVA